MVTTPHSIHIEEDDWECLGDYARRKKTSCAKIIQDLIYGFLSKKEVKDFTNQQIEKKKKIMSKRNVV